MRDSFRIAFICLFILLIPFTALSGVQLPAEDEDTHYWRSEKRKNFELKISRDGGTAISPGASVWLFGPSLFCQRNDGGAFVGFGSKEMPLDEIIGEEKRIPGEIKFNLSETQHDFKITRVITVTDVNVNVLFVAENLSPSAKAKAFHHRITFVDYNGRKRSHEFEAVTESGLRSKGDLSLGFDKICSLKSLRFQVDGKDVEITFNRMSTVEIVPEKADTALASIMIYPEGVPFLSAPLPGEKMFFAFSVNVKEIATK